MIPFVTKREPFIQLLTSTVIEQGKSLLQCLKNISNSTHVRTTQSEKPYNYYTQPQSGFFPREIADEAWTASVLVALYAFSSLYLYLTNKPQAASQADSPDMQESAAAKEKPPDMQQKLAELRELAALNTQLSIGHLFAGIYLVGDDKRVDKQLNILLGRANDELMEFYDAHPMSWNALFINNALQMFEAEPSRMLSSNGTFIQLVALANKSEDKALQARARQLYADYLKDEEIARYTTVPEFGHADSHAPDWDDMQANNYILLPSSYLKIAMLISQDTLEKWTGSAQDKPQQEAFHLYNAACVPLDFEDYPLADFFAKHYSLFDECHWQAVREKTFSQLLEIIMPKHKAMRELFFNARRQPFSQPRLTGKDNAQRLITIFAPWLKYSASSDLFALDDKHCRKLLDTIGWCNETAEEQAQALLSLSTFFVKSAGDKVFGSGKESPQALRRYAWALMSKAWSLDNNTFKDGMSYWEDVIIAAEDNPHNTDILANLMIEHNKQYFPEVFAEIMPPAWY